MMGPKKNAPGGGSLSLGGALTLENMNLDRREEFQGDAFNPFGPGQNQANSMNTKLQAQNTYIAKENTKGGQIWEAQRNQ